jgi:hypothetical protein
MNEPPFNSRWSAVIAGRWNRAILTPIGIARRLFNVGEQDEFASHFPLDSTEPPRVVFGGSAVIVHDDKLVVQSEENYSSLIRAMLLAKKALDELPLTPVRAAGFNIAFPQKADYEPLIRMLHTEWDQRFLAGGYELIGAGLGRKVRWRDGEINIAIARDRIDGLIVRMNFSRESGDMPDLRKWLSVEEGEVRGEVEKLLGTATS